MKPLLCISLLVLPFVASPASAQGTSPVVPTMFTHADAPASIPFPFYYDKKRVQHLVEGSRFCTTSAVLFSFAYRIDGRSSGAPQAVSLPNLTISLGYSSKTAPTMSTTFASNVQGTQTTVFSGTLNLPVQSAPPAGLGSFNIVQKLSKPFIYQRSQGNLLIQHIVPGQATQALTYTQLDGAVSGVPWGKFGTGGSFADQSQPTITIGNPTTINPGGSIDPTNPGMTSNYPTIHIYGFSSDSNGPLTLPFSLSPFGAPGNTLYCSLDLLVPATLKGGGSSWDANSSVPIPNSQGLNGAAVFLSSMHVDLKANKLGLVFGPALGTTVGWQTSCGMAQLYAKDSTATTGYFWISGGGNGAPVIQLTGTFQ